MEFVPWNILNSVWYELLAKKIHISDVKGPKYGIFKIWHKIFDQNLGSTGLQNLDETSVIFPTSLIAVDFFVLFINIECVSDVHVELEWFWDHLWKDMPISIFGIYLVKVVT